MKKILLIIIFLVTLTGCRDIRDLSYDEIVLNIQKNSLKDNVFRTGYSYYLPRGVRVSDTSLYNEVLEDHNNKYYLYVDIVSYYKKVYKEYTINDSALYSKKIDYDGKFGYVEVNNLKNSKYLVEIMYNYAKIEVIVDKINCKEAIFTIINILKSIEYNNSIIANLMGDDVLNFSEIDFNIFNTSSGESNYITVDEGYEEETEKRIDPDLIN